MNPFNFHQSRPGEKQLGDILKKKKDSEGDYVFLIISEDIGVRANGGRPGAAENSLHFYKAIATISCNDFLPSEKFGWTTISLATLQKESKNYIYPKDKKELYSLVNKIDKIVFKKIQGLLAKGKIPLVLGGGHNNAYPLLKALSETKKNKVHALNLDLHPDCRELEGRHSGNPFSYAKKNKILEKYAVLGLQELTTNIKSLNHFKTDGNWIYLPFESWGVSGSSSFDHSLNIALNHVCTNSVFGLEICADSIIDCPSSAGSQHGWSWNKVFNVAYQSAQTQRCQYIHLAEIALPLIHSSMQMNVAKSAVAALIAFVKGLETPHF